MRPLLLFALLATSTPGVGLIVDQAFHPDQQQSMVVKEPHYSAELRILKPACDNCSNEGRFRLDVSRDTALLGAFILPPELAQIDALQFTRFDKLLVFAHASSAVRGVVVIDLSARRQTDYFWCYDPVLSPDTRFIVYEKFYPAHTVGSPSAEYLLYDLSNGPERNRPHGISVADIENVGMPVFPLSATNSPADNLMVEPASTHWKASGFAWSMDSNMFTVVDKTPENTSLVVVSINPADGLVRGVQTIPLEKLLTQQRRPGCAPSDVHVSEIFMSSSDAGHSVRLGLSSPQAACLASNKLTLDVPLPPENP